MWKDNTKNTTEDKTSEDPAEGQTTVLQPGAAEKLEEFVGDVKVA